MALAVRNLPANAAEAKGSGSTPGLGRSLEQETATQSCILAWKIAWTEKPGGLQSTGPQSRTRLSTHTAHQEQRNGNCVGNTNVHRNSAEPGKLLSLYANASERPALITRSLTDALASGEAEVDLQSAKNPLGRDGRCGPQRQARSSTGKRDRKKSLRLTEAGFYYSPEHPRLAVAKVVN